MVFHASMGILTKPDFQLVSYLTPEASENEYLGLLGILYEANAIVDRVVEDVTSPPRLA